MNAKDIEMKTVEQFIEAISVARAEMVAAHAEGEDLWRPSLKLRDALCAPFQGTTSSSFGAAFADRHIVRGEYPRDDAWDAITRMTSDLARGWHSLVFSDKHLARDLGL